MRWARELILIFFLVSGSAFAQQLDESDARQSDAADEEDTQEGSDKDRKNCRIVCRSVEPQDGSS